MDVNKRALELAAELFKGTLKNIVADSLGKHTDVITEIRLCVSKSVALCTGIKPAVVPYTVLQNDVDFAIGVATGHNPLSAAQTISSGYITYKGARIGLSGEHMPGANGGYRHITGLCIRVPRECTGAAREICAAAIDNGRICSIVIASPPGGGKTTVLRDAARIIGSSFCCVLIDERGELAACSHGVESLNVGRYTHVLDGFNKQKGIDIAIRTLAPRVVLTDEIGDAADARALGDASRSGVGFLATMHAGGLDDALCRPVMRELISGGALTYIAVLGYSRGAGTLEQLHRVSV